MPPFPDLGYSAVSLLTHLAPFRGHSFALRLRRSADGFVSVLVLLLITLLAVMLFEFNYETRIAFSTAGNHYRSRQALHAAEAGVHLAMAALAKTDDFRSDPALRDLLSGEIDVHLGETLCAVSVDVENGKVNINRLKSGDTIQRGRVEQVLRLIDRFNSQFRHEAPAGYGIAAAMVDWTDADDDTTVLPFVQRENEGAESSYYQGLDPPRRCKNAPFADVNEVLLLRGVTHEILHGRPADGEEEAVGGIGPYLTVYGDGLIDLNHAPPEVLAALSDAIPPELARTIAEQRDLASFHRVEELLAMPGVTPEAYAAIKASVTVRPDVRYFRITATGRAEDFTRTVRVIARKAEGRIQIVFREEP